MNFPADLSHTDFGRCTGDGFAHRCSRHPDAAGRYPGASHRPHHWEKNPLCPDRTKIPAEHPLPYSADRAGYFSSPANGNAARQFADHSAYHPKKIIVQPGDTSIHPHVYSYYSAFFAKVQEICIAAKRIQDLFKMSKSQPAKRRKIFLSLSNFPAIFFPPLQTLKRTTRS